jgi:hypothetical protein
MTTSALIWVTARDGSVHATRPPILAAGHGTLCGRLYGRADLRVRLQAAPGHAPAHSCEACREAAKAPLSR